MVARKREGRPRGSRHREPVEDAVLPLFDTTHEGASTRRASAEGRASAPREAGFNSQRVHDHPESARAGRSVGPGNRSGSGSTSEGAVQDEPQAGLGRSGTSAPAAPSLRVDRHEPAAEDGARWKRQAIREARRLVSVHGEIRPSWLRAACEEPHHPASWGSVWARLRALGLRRTGEDAVSTVATRNAAREAVWRPGPDWE